MIGVNHLFPAPAPHLLERRAGVGEPALIIPEDPAFRVSHPGELGDIVGQSAKAFFAFAQRFLRLPALGDLRGRGQDGRRRALRIVVQAPAAEQFDTPAIACELDDFAGHPMLAAQLGDELLKGMLKFRF